MSVVHLLMQVLHLLFQGFETIPKNKTIINHVYVLLVQLVLFHGGEKSFRAVATERDQKHVGSVRETRETSVRERVCG